MEGLRQQDHDAAAAGMHWVGDLHEQVLSGWREALKVLRNEAEFMECDEECAFNLCDEKGN